MPTNRYRGDALAVAQLDTLTVGGTPAVNQVYSVTINGKVVSYTATGTDTNSTIALALANAMTASAIREFGEVLWAQDSGTTNQINATAQTAGRPFTVAAVSATGTGTLTHAAVTANTGPWNWDQPLNWTLGRIPAGKCAAPVQSAPSASSGGSLSNGTTYYWVVTATNPNGETTKSNEQNLAITTPNQTANLAWALVKGATGYKVYRSTTAGTYGASSLVATITSGSTLVYVDTGTATTTGQPPVSNTAIGDDVVVDGTLSSAQLAIKYGTNQTGILLKSLTLAPAGLAVGLPPYNGTYYEYRPRYLQIGADELTVGGASNGPSPAYIDLDGSNCAMVVESTGQTKNAGTPAVFLRNFGSGSSFEVLSGSVGLCWEVGDTGTLSGLEIGYQNNALGDVQLYCGPGLVFSTVDMVGGQVVVQSSFTTATVVNGTLTVNGDLVNITTLAVAGGNVVYSSDGVVGAATLSPGSSLDCSRDLRTKQFNSLTMQKGSKFLDPAGICVGPSAGNLQIKFSNCRITDVTVDVGANRTATFS